MVTLRILSNQFFNAKLLLLNFETKIKKEYIGRQANVT